MEDPRHPDRSEIALTSVLAALSDPVRLGLVRLLSDEQERGWGELRAPVAKSTLSHHLKVLRDAGVTRTRREGTRCYVQLRRRDLDARFPELLAALLSAAEADGVGQQVSATRDDPSQPPFPVRGPSQPNSPGSSLPKAPSRRASVESG